MYVHLFCRASSSITLLLMHNGENNGILGSH
jgi:hypothetical protein